MVDEISNKKICEHCKPVIANPNHYVEILFIYVGIVLGPFVDLFEKITPNYLKSGKVENALICYIIRIISFVGIANFIPVENVKTRYSNRTIVICDEAKRRGYTVRAVKIFNIYTNIFKLDLPKKSLIFQSLPLVDISDDVIDFDDKYILKSFLELNGFPYVDGSAFTSVDLAIQYGIKLGFPLVVKPRQGSLSRHTIVGIENEKELREAIKIVRKITNEFIVEKFIDGRNYRITLVKNKIVGCSLRESPNVVGDGISTIADLIKQKNNHPLRGEKHDKNSTLKKIEIDQVLKNFIDQQKFSLDDVPAKNKKIYLGNKIVLASGADIHDVTDLIHVKNVILFENISTLLNVSIIGFDVIMPCISRPYDEVLFGIIEANGVPYIDMHHFPVSGKSRNVASAIFDAVELDNE